ncbi:hypothetical protein B0T24DRAFT_516296 [Lasiosphaeria ovina]|uniref:2EXR domain-containing protein n=1 Tax=Lasiosphaeria ovina TaxID=92902 RepID=A0AAE0TXP1_9PEZI|nr:hypothetical protein B0T24DRAFT_516296 [Lasiosphaeria ovina]
MHYDHHFHRCCPAAATPDRFSNFQRLPAEIRNMIWEYSLPEARVYEVLDAPNAKQKTPAQQGLMFANVHPEPPPALAAVCRESRYFVLHNYKPLTLGATTKYVDLSRDILLLEPYLLVKRLHRTLHFMSQIPLMRDNINRLALGTSYGIYTGICHPVLSWKVSKTNMAKLLSSLAKFPKLKMLVFIVHQEFQFEFDFRFPGTMTPIPRNPLPPSISVSVPPSLGPQHGTSPGVSYPGSGNGGLQARATLSPLPSLAPPPRPTGFPPTVNGSSTLSGGGAPSISPPSQPAGVPPAPRPQLVHQAYRFKFDIEANINHTPRRPHLNELLYYPLDIDEDKDDWDLNDVPEEESEWCDPWPTNDDWRRFRKRFQRTINMSLEMNVAGGEEAEPAGPRGGAREAPRGSSQQKKMPVPALKGASLLWRYTRGGYV